MKILVYGGGAVGLGIAGALLKAGAEVDIIARNNTYLDLINEGLFVEGIFGEWCIPAGKFSVYKCISDSNKVYDFVLVAVKSNDSRSAAIDIYNACGKENTKIVLLQNGWGNFEIFSEYFNPENIYNGRVITGFSKPKPNTSKVTVHADDIHLGSLKNKLSADLIQLAEMIDRGGIPASCTENIEKDLWAKMLYNCSLNPVGAVFNATYGEIGDSKYLCSIMSDIIKEIFEIMKAGGYSTYWTTPEEYYEVLINKLIPPTSLHKSSTLQDIIAGKKTEIDALNGQILTIGEKFGIDVRVNKSIVNAIKYLENRNILK